MSAVNIICKRRHGCLHIVTDSASYVDGIVDGLGRPKVLTVPAWPGAITGRGPALAGAIVGETLSCKFPTFDEAVAGAEEVLPGILERFSDIFSTPYPDRLQVVIAGWSSERRQPESYVFNASEAAAPGATQEEIEANAHYLVGSKLVRLSNAISAPVLSEKITKESGFAGFDVDASPEEVIKALRITIEAQRHDEHPCVYRKLRFERIGDAGRRPGHAIRCVRCAEPGARRAHPCLRSGAFSRCCNNSHKIL